jgi:hypothetical protein
VPGSLVVTEFAGRTHTLNATCLWGPGQETVARVRAKLPGGIGDVSGRVLVIDFEGGSAYLIEGGPSLTLATGPGALGQPSGAPPRPTDRSTGQVVLDGARGPYGGTLDWTCAPPP